MEKLMNILMEIDSSIAWDKEEKLIDDRIMDSFMVISLISELEDQFQIDGELLNEVIEESVPVVEIAVATELDAIHVGTDNEQR